MICKLTMVCMSVCLNVYSCECIHRSEVSLRRSNIHRQHRAVYFVFHQVEMVEKPLLQLSFIFQKLTTEEVGSFGSDQSR